MDLEGYREWMQRLKQEPITDASRKEIEKAMLFSPDRFAKANGLGEDFVKEYQSDRKHIHGRLLDDKKIKQLKKRKVEETTFFYGGRQKKARICVCVKTMKNEEHRAKGGYKFYEGIKYNYAFADGFMGEEDVFIFDERGMKVYTTPSAFNDHFVDIREHLIDQILDI